MSDEQKPGATGQFPQGKLQPNDEGELKMVISSNDELVKIDFGKATAWIAFPKAQAIDFAILLLKHCGVLIEIRHQATAKGGPV